MTEQALELARSIVELLDEKKGENILLLDLRGTCGFTDFFVLCDGVSERTLGALSDDVQRSVKTRYKMNARSVEGKKESGWILLDYGDTILHLFSPAMRNYYRLEDLWSEGKVVLHMS